MLYAYAVLIGWLAYLAGLPPAEFAFGFVQDAVLPAAGATAQLSMVALSFAAVACFGFWCQSQAKLPSDTPLLLRMPRFVSTAFALNVSLNSLRRILLPALVSLRARYWALASTPSDLSGAAPLLL